MKILPSPGRVLVLFFPLLAILSTQCLDAQSKPRVSEPPLPVLMGSPQDSSRFPDEKSITLRISDFNRIMEREDSLGRAYSTETARLQGAAEKKDIVIYALLVILVVSNVMTFSIAKKNSVRKSE